MPLHSRRPLTEKVACAGGNVKALAACAASPATAGRVDASLELGKSLDVTGTPTLFINGRKISNVGGMPYDVLKQLVEFHAKQRK